MLIFTALAFSFVGPLSAQDDSAVTGGSDAVSPVSDTASPAAAPVTAAAASTPASVSASPALPAPAAVPAAALQKTDAATIPAGSAVTITITAPADAVSFGPAQPGTVSGQTGGLAGDAQVLSEAEQDRDELEADAEKWGLVDYIQRIGIALVIIAIQVLLIWFVWQRLFKWLTTKAIGWGHKNIKPLHIKKLHLLSTKQILGVIEFVLRILKYVLTLLQLYLTLPIIFSLFPLTQNLAGKLFGYILNPLKNIAAGLISFIPHLITIVIILWVAKYALRLLKFFATQIEKERLVIPGFYADWAAPTFNILRVLVYAFTVVVIYPYLPGSGSAVFQGVSVFIGVIFSLGSSSAIGNLIAGLVITYMRPFKVGDRIQFQNITGFVVEKSLTVIRIRTHKNEFVTFPNTMVLNSSIVNYNTSADEKEEGLILHADVTMGYGVPWTQVHEILIAAALKTGHVQTEPKPFVLQTALDDFYAKYEINAYTKDVDLVPRIYSELYQNLQDGFREAGISLTAPAYQIWLPPEAGG
jgi:small-conductance mechanosensitive channel